MLSLLPVFISAGFWQLDRAEYKQQQKALFNAAKSQPAKPLVAKLPTYARVKVTGTAQPKLWWIQNQLHEGMVGMAVMQAIETKEAGIVFVLVGWLPTKSLEKPMDLQALTGQIDLEGVIYPLVDNPWIDATRERPDTQMISALDYKILAALVDGEVYPHVIRLRDPIDSRLMSVLPEPQWAIEKHHGYAFQWFSFAVLSLVLWAFYSVKREKLL